MNFFEFLIFKDKRLFTISNFLTLLRIILSPVVVWGIFLNNWVFAFGIFFLASLTDLLDGYLARLFNEKTRFGALLDPLADKIFLLSLFGALVFIDSPSFPIPNWFFIIVVTRELIILVGAAVLLIFDFEFNVEPTFSGKLTTFFYILFISWVFVCHFLKWLPMKTFFVLLVMLSLFSLLSLFYYVKIGLKIFIKYFRKGDKASLF
jgi:cardiolipin synthase (CMP-forming)